MPLDKTDDMGDWIKDFQKSKAPQFKGKSQEKRRQMAIAAKLATENNALRESDITIYEKRAFILAAKQAFLDGKKTFMFKEKEYKCTVKEEQDLFGELTDYLLSKKEDVDTATMADVDDGADAPGDIDPEDLESARDHAAQRFKKFNSEEQEMQENKAKNVKAVTSVLQTLRKVDGKTKGHRMAMMDLLTMFSPKEIEKAYKANKRGFTNLMNMMYPRNKDALTISDLTVDGQFMAKTGRLLSRDQTKQLGNPLDKIQEVKEKLKMPDISDRGTAGHKKFVIFRAKLYRKLKLKTKGEKYAVDEMLTLFDPNHIMKAFKHHPSGFKGMMNKMYPRENKKLDKGDFTVYDVFIDRSGKEVPVQKEDKDLPPHTDIQESTIGDTLFKGSSNGQLPQWSKTRLNFDPFKFHDMKIGKPLVAHVFEKEVYKDNVFTDNYDVVYFTDGKYMLSVMGDREKHPGGSNYGAEDASEMLVINKDGKANYNDFKKAVMKDAKTYNQAPMKLLKVDTKVRDFSKSPNSQDSTFTLRKMPKTAFRPSKDDIQEVKYHDRESMPSAVDDAANVMSKLDVYANFIKKTY